MRTAILCVCFAVGMPIAMAIVACGESATTAGREKSGDGGDAGQGADAAASSDAGPSPGPDAGSPSGSDAGGEATVTLDFIGADYTMYASIAGGPAHIVQLDTGSIGLYVPKAAVGSSAQISTTDACSITYVSSGNTLTGHKAIGAVTLLGSKASGDVATPPVTMPMSFCAVDDPTWSGGMMGVGFGRSASAPDPTRNVLLEMAVVASGQMRAGYILSTHPSPHVQIGVSAASSAGFQTIALTPDPGGSGDWVATSLRGCLSAPSKGFGPECGGMLVDTGVADTLLWGPSDPTLGGVVPAGQTTVPKGVALTIAAQAGASILDYAFTVGSGTDSPAAVSIRSASAFSINTGRALLVDYDYLFDAKSGVVGFRRAP